MTTGTDSWRRPVYVDRRANRLFAEPLIGGGVWPEVQVSTVALSVAQTFTAAQRGAIVPLTDGPTIAVDFSLSNNFSVTLGGSRTLGNPVNTAGGQSGAIVITQDSTGGRALAYESNWIFPGGIVPTLSTAADAVDVLVYFCDSPTRIFTRVLLNFQ